MRDSLCEYTLIQRAFLNLNSIQNLKFKFQPSCNDKLRGTVTMN